MSQPRQAGLESLWAEARNRYEADVRRYEEEAAEYRKKHQHLWNRTSMSKKQPDQHVPMLSSALDFELELGKRQSEFKKMRKEHHAVFKAMRSLATPVEIIGGQAAAVGDMFAPACSTVFGAVMYLFQAGKEVTESFDVLEDLFSKCGDAITQISQLVGGVRFLPLELQSLTIESLVGILNVFRIATEYAKSGRLKAYAQALIAPGQGNDAKKAFDYLMELSSKRDTTVGISTYVALDHLDAKHDRQEGKIDFNTSLSIDIRNQVFEVGSQIAQIAAFRREDKPENEASKALKDVKQSREDKARRILRNLLSPTIVADRTKEFTKTTSPGTCQWIFDEPEFHAWKMQDDVPVLWIYGESGAGKTHLAAHIAANIGQSSSAVKSPVNSPVAIYFCDYRSHDSSAITTSTMELERVTSFSELDAAWKENKNGFEQVSGENSEKRASYRQAGELLSVFKSLSLQICEEDKRYEKELTEHLTYVANKLGGDSDLTSTFNTLFRNNYVSSLQGKYLALIIDGVDNLCPASQSALYLLLKDVITTARKSKKATVKVIALGQTKLREEIRSILPEGLLPSIEVTKNKNQADIESYISWTIKTNPKLSRALRDPKLHSETVKSIANTTQGVFEMSALLLKQLSQKDHKDLFSEILQNPPEDIQTILHQTLVHFGQTHTAQDIEDFNSILSWVMCAQVPLTLSQLNSAVGFESGHGEFLDIRDKITKEFSAYFSIIDPSQQDPSNPTQSQQPRNDLITESSTGLESDLDHSTIKVAHASIATFFRGGKSLGIAEKGLSVGTSFEDAHLRLAKTCLRVLCTSAESLKSWESMESVDRLLAYAAQNFKAHLSRGKSSATLADRIEIFKNLTKMFRDEKTIERWIREANIYPDWCHLNSLDLEVWSWLSDEEVIKDLPLEDTSWILDPGRSIIERWFKPITMWFAKQLLQIDTPEVVTHFMFYFVYLHVFIQLIEWSNHALQLQQPLIHPYIQATNLTAAEIRKVAQWAGFEATALWHLRVGYVLFETIQPTTDELLEDFRTSLRLTPNFGPTLFTLATSYAYLKKYDLAIETIRQARKAGIFLPASRGGVGTVVAQYIAQWQVLRSDTLEAKNEAMATLQSEIDANPNNFRCIASYIRVATLANNRAIMSQLQKLGRKLGEFLAFDTDDELHLVIRRAAQQMKRVALLKRAYEEALVLTKDNRDSHLAILDAAAKLYAENQEDDHAIAKYSALINLADDLDGNYTAIEAESKIGQIYFTALYRKSGKDEELAGYIRELEKLDKEDHVPELTATRWNSGLMLGLYYRLNGKDEKARPYFKERIALAMTLLEDDIADNDCDAWGILFQTLLKGGDTVNAVIAAAYFNEAFNETDDEPTPEKQPEQGKLSQTRPEKTDWEKVNPEQATDEKLSQSTIVTSPTAEPETNETNIPLPKEATDEHLVTPSQSPPARDASTTPMVPNYPPTPWTTGTCDGPCNLELEEHKSGVYICALCNDCWFCADCYEKLVNNSLPFILCDWDHEFVYATGIPKGVPEGKVVVGGVLMEIKEWLVGLKKEWGVGEFEKVDVKEEVDKVKVKVKETSKEPSETVPTP